MQLPFLGAAWRRFIPYRTAVVSPQRSCKLSPQERTRIKRADFLAPVLGQPGFGKVKLSFRWSRIHGATR